MSAAVKLSPRSARALLDAFNPQFVAGNVGRALDEIRRQLEPRQKSSQVRKREARNRAKAKETRSIYEQVAERAGGHCEACSLPFDEMARPELDHFRGRGKARQTVENTWLIHGRSCHFQKTNNVPSRVHWLSVFREHCVRHGYTQEARRVEADIDFERAKRGGE